GRADARATVAIDGHARDRIAESGLEGGVASDVVAGRALRKAAAHDHVLDLRAIDAGALDRMTQHVRRHRDAVGLVERAPSRASDAGSAIRDDGDVLHETARRAA